MKATEALIIFGRQEKPIATIFQQSCTTEKDCVKVVPARTKQWQGSTGKSHWHKKKKK